MAGLREAVIASRSKKSERENYFRWKICLQKAKNTTRLLCLIGVKDLSMNFVSVSMVLCVALLREQLVRDV